MDSMTQLGTTNAYLQGSTLDHPRKTLDLSCLPHWSHCYHSRAKSRPCYTTNQGYSFESFLDQERDWESMFMVSATYIFCFVFV